MSARLEQPVKHQRMLRYRGIEMWINLQKNARSGPNFFVA
ncbi:hypothetical protein SynMEDNS5_01061 [Synechococcus sp. MEDNS5]|nr:hypothetical protein SynMEDNS5_01061 [Synechococcus sp. MEDNS5]